MRLISSVCAVAVIAAAGLFAPDALAQRNRATTVVVVNYQRLLAESALGRDIQAKLQQVRTQVSTEAQALGPENQAIETERQSLATATRNMTADQVRNSSTLAPQIDALQQRVEQFQRRTQGLQGDLECTQAIALRDFNTAVSPVVRSAMESRGAGVVLDAQSIQFVTPEFDITQAVIEQLDQNQATRTSSVVRHAVTDCQAQQPPTQ